MSYIPSGHNSDLYPYIADLIADSISSFSNIKPDLRSLLGTTFCPPI